MKPVIKVCHTFFDKPLDTETFNLYCAQLPLREQEKLHRFRRWEDATASITGKILLNKLLADMGMEHIRLADMKYSDNDRPYFNDTIDFNITHSGACVACAIAVDGRVGIDVEKLREIKISDLRYVLTDNEYESVNTSPHRNRAFYNIWTKKEAIIKADGRGLNIELKDIDTTFSPVKLGNELWQIKQVPVESGFIMNVAYNGAGLDIEQVFVD